MATKHLSEVLRHLTRRMVAETLVEQSDRRLVEEFLARRDEAVFTALVNRHGPMVYRVCWRVLEQEQDAEDAFQATFLVLAQKLHTVRKHDSLASWLHGIARRVALKARGRAAMRRRYEQQVSASQPVPSDEVTWGELRMALDAELTQLPDKWRLPLILCYLEGRTQDQAADHLGWSRTTLQRRLAEAREALGRRLSRRGVVWPAALSAVLLSDCVAPAALAPGLVGSTVEAAACVSTAHPAISGVSANVAVLTEGVLKAMLLTKLKIATAVLMVLTLIGAGLVVLTCSLSMAGDPQAKEAEQPAAPKSIVGVGEGVQNVVWSPNGKFLAVLTNIYDVAEQEIKGEKKKILFEHCTLMLWDVEKKAWLPTTVPLEAKVRVWALAISPDSKTLAFGLQDLNAIDRFDIRLVDVEKGKEKKSFPFGEEQGAEIRGVVFTSNDTLAVWGRDVSERSVLKLFDVEKEKPKGVVHAKAPRDTDLTCFAFSSDGKSSALAIDSTIRVAKPGKIETVPLESHSEPIFSLAFSPDARFLVSGSRDNTVKVWDLSNDQLLHTLTADDQPLNAVALSPDGRTVAMGIVIRKDGMVAGQEVRLFDVQTGKLKRTLKVTGMVGVVTLAFSPDGRALAAGGLGVDADLKTLGDLRLWPLAKK
jgi:RNA polymerase sigma factor (sigma-70 family)